MAIWTGTVSVTNGDATVTVDSGDALNQFNCTADSMVVIDGIVYFVLSRTDTATLELTRNYAGSTGTGVAAEISPINQTTASLLTLSASASRLASQLDIFNKTGPWFYYTLAGATGDTDPGAGNAALSTLDFGSLSAGDAMSVYLDNVDGKNRTISGLLDTLVSGTIITIQSLNSTSYVSMQLSTGIVDGTGYRKSDATYISHDGVLSAAEPIFIAFARVGQGLEIDAQGAFADRDDYDAEAEGFMYYSVDGDGETGIGTLYRKASNTSGDWSVGGVLQGTQGPQGEQGEQGIAGNDGADGDDGASAYEVAVAEGFSGTVTEWLASLEGADGADGLDGADGADGTDPGFLYSWNTGTSNSNLGSGYLWADTTLDAATKLFVSKTNRAGDDLSQALADAVISTNTRKANLVLTRSSGNAQARVAITGLVDHTGYVEFTIASSSHAGATGFDLNDAVSLQINQIGNQGSVGPGGGDIVGPESSTIGNLLKWTDEEGTEAEDSGISADDVALNSDNLSGLENKTEALDNLSLRGTAIASDTTTDLSTATGRFVHITGTTTITALGTAAAGVERHVTFDGALTLTHNATSLILPGGANITTAAGDTAVMMSEGSGNWRCLQYTRKSGKAVVPPAFSEVTSKPTTVAGYGITDAAVSFATRADAAAYNPSSSPVYVQAAAYSAAGAGGGALYKLSTRGPELVKDGGFLHTRNWIAGAGLAVTGGRLVLAASGGGVSAYQYCPLTSGKTYEVTFTVSSYSAGGVRFRAFDSELTSVQSATTRSADGTYTEQIVAGSDVEYIGLAGTSASNTLQVDNLSIREVWTSSSGPIGGFENALGDWYELVAPPSALSARSFGVVADGVTDDRTALQDALNYIAAYGGRLRLPAGVISLEGTAVLSIPYSNKPFSISGAGRQATKIVRNGNSGSVISLHDADDWTIEDLSIDAGLSRFPTNANHGIVWYDCDRVRVRRVHVENWSGTAIIGYTSNAAADPPTHEDNVIEDCSVDGLDSANNGILLADLARSHIRNCNAVNIGKSGSPCYALQLKNGCQDSSIVGGYASGASGGVVAGGDSRAKDNHFHGTKVFDCDTGASFGVTTRPVVSDLVIDMNSAGNHAVDLQGGTVGMAASNLVVRNLASGKAAVECRSGDTDNSIEVGMLDVSATHSALFAFLSGALRNTVVLRKMMNPTTFAPNSVIVSNAGGETNSFQYGDWEQIQSATIASGAIAVRDRLTRLVKVDTEASAGTDDLTDITGGTDGQMITLFQAVNARDVTVKYNSAKIRLNGSADFVMTNVAQTLTLMYSAALECWVEVARGTAI